jgi:hypothetical protein
MTRAETAARDFSIALLSTCGGRFAVAAPYQLRAVLNVLTGDGPWLALATLVEPEASRHGSEATSGTTTSPTN